MVIRSREEYREILSRMPNELVNNPEFKLEVEDKIIENLNRGVQVSITGNDDLSSIRIIPQPVINRKYGDEKSELDVLEVKLGEEGQMEVIESHGILHDANSYYRQRPYATRTNDSSSVLDTFYTRRVFDKDGIELEFSSYSKAGWDLTRVRYDDTQEFQAQLLSEGYHKPRTWTQRGPELPQFCSGAMVSGIARYLFCSGIAELYSYEVGTRPGDIKNTDIRLGAVHTEWPERLRVDYYQKFGEYKDGKWVVSDVFDRYKGMSMDDVFRDVSLSFEQGLETSKTKEYYKGQYESLKSRVLEQNAKYKNQETLSEGKHI